MNIVTRDIPPRAAWALEQAGVHPLLARLFAGRGLRDTNEGLLRYKALPEFADEATMDAAVKAGQIKRGTWVRVAGQTGQAQ